MPTRILKPRKSSVTTAKTDKRTKWTAKGESAHPHRHPTVSPTPGAPRPGALPRPVLKAMPCSSYCKGSIRCFFTERSLSCGTCPQIPLQLHRTARLITFPAAGWTVRTADNKNSLGDGCSNCICWVFLFLYTWSFQGCFSLMNSDRWHLRCFWNSVQAWHSPGHLWCSIFLSRNKEINLSKKKSISLNWDITRKWNLNPVSKNI